MLKRLSAIAAVFFILTAFLTPAFAGTYSAADAIADALRNNSNYYREYSGKVPGQDKNIHYITTSGLSKITDRNDTSYGFLTYGQPHGDLRDGHHRYIGYTYYGEDYTSMDFPADQNANGADFASQNWIKQPWNDSAVKASNPKLVGFPGDGSTKYHAAIMAGILIYGAQNANNGYKIINNNTAFWNNVEQYVHILAPPTEYAWGIGRMWHYKNGSLMYITVPIMPTALLSDLAQLVVTPLSATVNVGGTKQYTAIYYPQGQQAGGGQDVTRNCSWTVQDSSVASIGANTGLATGNAEGGTNVTANYTPPDGSALTGIATLTVQTVQQQINLAVTITSYPEQARKGEAITVTGEITSDSDTPIKTLVQWYLDSQKVYEGNVNINKTQKLNFPLTMPDSDTLVTVQVNPGHNQPPDESDWDDNKDSATINLTAPAPPPVTQTGSGLTFQAVSQYSVVTGKPDTGNSIREPNAARWTDTVTAYLRPLEIVSSVSGNDAIDYTTTVAPPKPDMKSECGTDSYNQLDDYSITATLVYPKQNPRFTFGDPVPPVGTDQNYDFKNKLPPAGSTLTTKLTWNSQEQAAIGQFKEMWAENGIRLQSIMHPELNSWIQSPQDYMLKATNISVTVDYTTHYNIRRCPSHGG